MQQDDEDTSLVQQSSKHSEINWWPMLLKPCLAEFVGTTLFVFAGILSAFHASENVAVVNVALGHGLALFVMVAATAAVSGGHLNPAVTLGVFCSGTIAPGVALGYVAAQLLGSITASGLAKGLINATSSARKEYWFAVTEPGTHESDVQALFTETFLTAILVLTVLTLAVETRGQNQMAPFAIGMAVAAGIFAAALGHYHLVLLLDTLWHNWSVVLLHPVSPRF
jgi:glycerol uptake facilitator-like aquaporin